MLILLEKSFCASTEKFDFDTSDW